MPTMPALDESSLPPYSVILVPGAFGSPEPKRFVVVGHEQGAAICVKTTSKTLPYKNSIEMMESCVFYRQGDQPQCFSEETAVQPDNTVAYLHTDLSRWYAEGTLHIFGSLPTDQFELELLRALEGGRASETRKKKIAAHVAGNKRNREAARER